MGVRVPTNSVMPFVALAVVLGIIGCGGGAPVPTPSLTQPPTELPTEEATPAERDTQVLGLVSGGAGIAVPQGFGANVFFLGLSNPTSIAVADDGRVFVSEQDGDIAVLEDDDSDGTVDSADLYARGFVAPLGLLHHEDTLYVSHRGSITALVDSDGDGQVDDIETIVSDLPVGIHQNNGLAVGPDGKMYLTLGSTCNACRERSEFK